MIRDSYVRDEHHGGMVSPEIELIMAQNVGDAKSLSFVIPSLWCSLLTEQQLIGDLLQYLHGYLVPAQVIVPTLKFGHGPDATVDASGLVLMIGIQGMTPQTIVCVRVYCREVLRRIAQNKRHWAPEEMEYLNQNILGKLQSGNVASEVETFIEEARTAYLTDVNLTNGLVHFRVNDRGTLETVEVDFTEDSTGSNRLGSWLADR